MKDNLMLEVDLDIGSIMKSKYNTYKEYHTSNDDLNKVVTPKGLLDSFSLIKKIILRFEKNHTDIYCEMRTFFIKEKYLLPIYSRSG